MVGRRRYREQGIEYGVGRVSKERQEGQGRSRSRRDREKAVGKGKRLWGKERRVKREGGSEGGRQREWT
jgi:hypothetical protein